MRRKRTANKNPIARIVLGFLVLLGASVLLWRNEGRINLADVARKSEPADGANIDPALDGEFVSVTARLETAVPVGDDQYLRKHEFVQLDRWVEMYAWVEKEDSDEGETNTSYELTWTNDPRSAEEFEQPAGHKNPPMPVYEKTFTAESATIGLYHIDLQEIELPKAELLPLSLQNVLEGPYRIDEQYLFEGQGSLEEPLLGDVRISFTAVPAGMRATAFGIQTGQEIMPYVHRGKTELYRVLAGNREQAFVRLNAEYKNLLWGFRTIGLGLMWLGFGLLASPLTALLRFIPILGDLSRKAIGALTFIMALLLAVSISSVSAIFHNIWALLALLLFAGVAIYLWRRDREPKLL